MTKKAIEYYIEQNLIFPVMLDNGYRDFSSNDIERLKKISILRKLGLSTGEIKIVLFDENGDALQKLSVQNELNVQRERAKNTILDKLSYGKSYTEISTELVAIEMQFTGKPNCFFVYLIIESNLKNIVCVEQMPTYLTSIRAIQVN